ncbi:HD domain-containing phosphohydrolase [Conexibacter sp. JD483]|uniref:HD-GYP domain-containing protein n=1 Tax=unclassified Conexibacter TaxID=2627773 RepID=UPI00272235F3|nr:MULTISPECIES: HD-GYP domain-containing protein [unclassified Conexibacter]MDO8185462.1 HD domain-containing phosphohydrolase [Conexibacter sp. CPCC 205706]MDO8197351.1 HD domain-containing phosphohydrolase [Conexibacter sp. CPCC 205762]MDR9372810.1 HD domain-containing phosphohydrolase [Conexibacter sp. JD483]
MAVSVANPVVGELRLSEVLAALSHALDLTEGQPPGHAERTCLIALRIADGLGLGEQDRAALFYAALLKDTGCSNAAARFSALFAGDDIALKQAGKFVDWTRPQEALRFTARHVGGGSMTRLQRARQFVIALRGLAAEGSALVTARCERGADVVAALGLPAAASDAVRALDERWDGSGQPYRLTGEQLPLLGRVLGLAQTAEVFLTGFGRAAARTVVARRSGGAFDPRVADAFLAIGDDDRLWHDHERDDLSTLLSELEPGELVRIADEHELDRVAEAFARVIDAKSPYTASHSVGVARFAVAIGRQLGFQPGTLRDLNRAGLLHDVGKLAISSAILDKPGRLTDEEFRQIRMHAVYGEQILRPVRAFAAWSDDAAAHHERLDGRGYHRGLDGSRLSPFARTLAVADVFEALTAERPYRGPLAPDEALALMRREVGTAFCPHAFAALEAVAERDGLAAAA